MLAAIFVKSCIDLSKPGELRIRRLAGSGSGRRS